MTASRCDAIVVGGPCAGAPAAVLLAEGGHRDLLVDRSTFPGGTLSTPVIQPEAVADLERRAKPVPEREGGQPAMDALIAAKAGTMPPPEVSDPEHLDGVPGPTQAR